MIAQAVSERIAHHSPKVRLELVMDVSRLATFDLDVDRAAERAFAAALSAAAVPLLALLSDPIWEVRAATCRAIADLSRTARTVEPHDDAQHLAELAKRLGDLGPALGLALRDARAEVRAAGVRALYEVAGAAAQERLAPVIDDADDGVEAAVLSCLVEIEAADAGKVVLRRLRRLGPRVDAKTVRDAHRLELPSDEALAVLRPLASAQTEREVRRAALLALIEHADASCAEVLIAALADEPVLACLALARLGPQARISAHQELLEAAVDKTHFFALAILAATSERVDLAPVLVSALARTGDTTQQCAILDMASALPSPALSSVALHLLDGFGASSLVAPESIARLGPVFLALGAAGEPVAIDAVVDKVRAVRGTSPLERRLRARAAVAIALLDPEHVPWELVPTAGDVLWSRLVTHERAILPFAFAIRLLSRRLLTSSAPLGSACGALVHFLASWMQTADVAGGVRCYRDRGGIHGIDSGWIFTLTDLFAEARRNFAALEK